MPNSTETHHKGQPVSSALLCFSIPGHHVWSQTPAVAQDSEIPMPYHPATH